MHAEVVLHQEELACPVVTGLAQPVAGLHPPKLSLSMNG